MKLKLCLHHFITHAGIIANPRNSLFIYDEFGSWSTFYRPEYKPMFEPQFNDSTLQEQAQEVHMYSIN